MTDSLREEIARLIPACAGKTRGDGLGVLVGGAHPRVCGENNARLAAEGLSGGSSPRVRGKQSPPAPTPPYAGLIPACAGKTRRFARAVGRGPAHPRVCGENCPRTPLNWMCNGSSPRVRGKQIPYFPVLVHRRLIPACAGKTITDSSRSKSLTAHPRVCGENPLLRRFPTVGLGSSPRVRGKLILWVPVPVRLGLIPACAGKTCPASRWRRGGWAHPRVCGENPPPQPCAPRAGGSSPRVRGKRECDHGIDVAHGLIPACAGKTDEPLVLHS